jgi:hypothetical protein
LGHVADVFRSRDSREHCGPRPRLRHAAREVTQRQLARGREDDPHRAGLWHGPGHRRRRTGEVAESPRRGRCARGNRLGAAMASLDDHAGGEEGFGTRMRNEFGNQELRKGADRKNLF